MATNRITFGEWLPDQPGVIGALTTAKNCYPKAVGYGPFPEEVDYSQSADATLTNLFSARDNSGNAIIFASSATKLYKLNATNFTFDNVSATTYTSSTMWRFTQFGNKLIAASETNTLQSYDISSPSTFSNLSADAPKAKFITVVRDFVVTGYQDTYKNRVQWSGINNETTWTASGTTQSDYQDIPDGGNIQGITGGEFGIVLMERGIYRMTYVGTPLVFQFDNISRNLGCYEPNSVIQWQGITYFLSDDGFYSCDGQNIINIGSEKINRYFFNSLRSVDIADMSTAVDPAKNLVIWGYPSTDLTYRLLIYHVPTKRWSYAETAITKISQIATPSKTLESLDTVSASLDDLDTPLDSRLWVGGKLQFAGLNGAKIVIFSGMSKTAVINTADLEIDSNNKSMITLLRPLVDNGSGNACVASRQKLDETVDFPVQTTANSENRIGVRSFGRYHRVSLTPTGDNWSSAIGVDIEIQQGGNR